MRLGLLLVFGIACSGGSSAPTEPTGNSRSATVGASEHDAAGGTMTRMQGNSEATEFVVGPSADSGELLAWFQSHAEVGGKRARLRVPVVVAFEDSYRLALGEAFVGGPGDSAEGRLRLYLDDGGLGVALIDTVRSRCAQDQQTCALWLEGFWGNLIDDEDLPGRPGAWPFAVLRVGPLVAPGEKVSVMVAATSSGP